MEALKNPGSHDPTRKERVVMDENGTVINGVPSKSSKTEQGGKF